MAKLLGLRCRECGAEYELQATHVCEMCFGPLDVVFDYAARYPEAIREMGGWMAAGKLQSREDIVEGFDNFPSALRRLFRGANHGKLVVHV